MTVLAQISTTSAGGWQRVASLRNLQEAGCMVVKTLDRPVALFYHEGAVFAVDNRCPHLGFPLHRGSVQEGILICHWHHARFDLASGCTFDLWADDIPSYPVHVDGDDIFLTPTPRNDGPGRLFRRLRIGMEQNVSLIVTKSTIGLLKEGTPVRDLVREAALFGVRNRDGFGSGMVILGAMANLANLLPSDTAALALSQGVSAAARDTAGMAPRRERYPLDRDDFDLATARKLFRHWTLARHRDGAERTLATILRQGCTPAEAADILFTAITDRFYADAGHTLDFANKAMEIAEFIGWDHAQEILPALSPGIVGARGAEESSPWRSPVDLVALLNQAFETLPQLLADAPTAPWSGESALADQLLTDNPPAIIEALLDAVRSGAQLVQLGRALALAAATRIARFGTANEFGDWDTALHTFTYANAIHQALKRCPTAAVLRGVFHGALSVYQDRFLNIPPAPLPLDDDQLSHLPASGPELLQELREALNKQQQTGDAGRLVSRYLGLGLPVAPLLAELTYVTVREDAAFHTFQMLEAAIRQYHEWEGAREGRIILIAAARYIAAHAPTTRSFLQSFEIAERLHRGDALHEDA